MGKRILPIAIVVTLLLGLLVACAKPAQPEQEWTKPISIGSGSIGSSHYVIQTGCAAIITKYAGISATCEATKWSAYNVELLRDKKIELSSCTADAVYDAWYGKEYFEGNPQSFVRLYHSGYASTGVNVARADSGIRSHADLKGKRYYAWMPTSPVMMRFVDITLSAHGLTKNDVILMEEVSTKEAVAALKENRADAALIVGSLPTAAVIELATTMDVVLLPVGEAEIKVMKEKYPYIYPDFYPANTYKGQTKDIYAFGVKSSMICHSDLPDNLIYRVVKALMEHPEEVVAIHPACKTVTLQDFFSDPQAPFHPGAIKYYKEQGVWTKDMDKWQEKMLKGVK